MPKYDIYFKNPLNGETVIYKDDFDFYDSPTGSGADWVIYMYTRGNYACDCNRSSFMNIDGLDLDCGHTIELIKIVENGTDRITWPNEYYVKLAVKREKFQYKLVNEGEPGKLAILDKNDRKIGNALVNPEAYVDENGDYGFSITFQFADNTPLEFNGKTITDFEYLEGEMVFNIS